MTAGTPESAYPNFADNPAIVPGPNAHMPSFFVSVPRVLTWGIQLLPTRKKPKNLATAYYMPQLAVTGPNALDPTPLRGAAAPPSSAYANMPTYRAPGFSTTGGSGGTACPTTR